MTITPADSATASDPSLLATLRAELREIYRDLDQAVAQRGPRCLLSGRCCQFEDYGHTLFLSEPEAMILIADAPKPSSPLDDGKTCPWQDSQRRCTAREARPLGCRVYFCDPAYEPLAPEISEEFIARLKQLASRLNLSWNYGPLHRHLREAANQGLVAFPEPMGQARIENL